MKEGENHKKKREVKTERIKGIFEEALENVTIGEIIEKRGFRPVLLEKGRQYEDPEVVGKKIEKLKKMTIEELKREGYATTLIIGSKILKIERFGL